MFTCYVIHIIERVRIDQKTRGFPLKNLGFSANADRHVSIVLFIRSFGVLIAVRADPKNAKDNLKKSSVGAVEGYMFGKDGQKKAVGAAKERDEMLKKKLENAIATGKTAVFEKCMF